MRLACTLADSGLVELLINSPTVPLHPPSQKLLGSFMSIQSPSTGMF